jgi:hypothetical protein
MRVDTIGAMQATVTWTRQGGQHWDEALKMGKRSGPVSSQ